MEVEWVKRFPLSIKNSSLLNNKPTIKFLWLVNKCFSFFDPLSGVEKYVAVIDIFGEEQMKVRQFILFMTPSLKKNGQRTLSRIFFCPTSCEAKFEVNGNGEEHSCFCRIIEKLEELFDMNGERGWLPKGFQLTTEQINNIVKRKCMVMCTKDDLIGELQMEEMCERHKCEVEASESEKFYKKMKKKRRKEENKNINRTYKN